jgi:site-specific recombinase XerD
MADMIPADPYERVKLSRGKSKERQPLTEDELDKLRTIKLSEPMDHVRDLFIFSAYTGLAYCDVQIFNFEQMTEKIGKIYYIDGERLKTGTKFFTPILNPAMEVLKKYDYNLPKITNQKGNEYLHLIQHAMGLRKSLTFHVARHSFATLAISHGVPIEDVARMLGHEDIRTTQIYAKILKTTINQYSTQLQKAIK